MKTNKSGGAMDIHSMLPKIPLNPPGFKYLGPNNPLEEQVDEHGIPKPGNEPTSALDGIALKHDLLYDKAEKTGKSKQDILNLKHSADKLFIEEAKVAPKENLYQRVMNWLARMIIGAKVKLGFGIDKVTGSPRRINIYDIDRDVRKIKNLNSRKLIKYLLKNNKIIIL